MPRPRQHLVNVQDTPYYHVTSRCVRRAFLCGHDNESGKSYEHRRQWLEDRIRLLSSVFAIDLCAYAVMTNHYHIVLKLAPEQAGSWSELEVLKRWRSLHKGTLLVQKFFDGNSLSQLEQKELEQTIVIYKERLTNLSWFMKCLNEPIARMANAEDECTGHFWEARFTSQALLTDQALLASMVYVDLNPVRAKMADTPETSDHTSIKERIKPQFELQDVIRSQLGPQCSTAVGLESKHLAMFLDHKAVFEGCGVATTILPFRYVDYLKLVDMTGRLLRQDKRGAISSKQLPILERLSIPPSDWASYTTQFEQLHRRGEFRLRG